MVNAASARTRKPQPLSSRGPAGSPTQHPEVRALCREMRPVSRSKSQALFSELSTGYSLNPPNKQ